MIKTAVFGGAFDPVHDEHIKLALAMVEELGIEKLVLLPASNPPHKDIDGENFSNRVKLLKHAFKNFIIDVEVSELEHNNKNQNYTVENLPKLIDLYGNFYYLIGGDSLLNFEKWYKPDEIVKLANVVVFKRQGYTGIAEKAKEFENKWQCNIRVMDYVGKDISSSSIRARLYLNMDTNGLNDDILKFIYKNKLYNKYDKTIKKARAYLTSERLKHSKNTVLMAIDINNRCNLKVPFNKVFLAGILHDIGKKYDNTQYYCNSNKTFNIPKLAVETAVQHQYVGAEIALNEFNINDEDILNAIRYHTTGRIGMSNLEKIIFVADMLSTERNFSGIDNLRDKVYNNFNEGFYLCIKYGYDYLLSKQKAVYPLTKQAVDYYKENK